MSNPSLGVYIPPQLLECSLVASVAFPREFLLGHDNSGKKVFCKTTALEALGILTAICLDPLRFAGREALFLNDNMSTVRAFGRGYSKDEWTTCIVRASRVVAAAIGASIFVSWERKRSSRGAEIADNLTHNILEGLTAREVEDFVALGLVAFPPPILEWMGNPGSGRSLGACIVRWMFCEYPALELIMELNTDIILC